ncbi:MAG: hypothetical protein ACPHCN_16565 [Mycobacterium sp.]
MASESQLYSFLAGEFDEVAGASEWLRRRFGGQLCTDARRMAYHASRVIEGYTSDPLEGERVVLGRSKYGYAILLGSRRDSA